ncbi:MAG: hypothetical protein H7239_03400 [Flavobacterium sp.]|nr:hypothetical protein [Flavobacterium sp.]
MKQYKYSLDKSSKKFICPKCNKRTFVLYIETETKNYLGEDFGRCDRESNCSYHNTPTGEDKNTFEIVNVPKPLPNFHSLELIEKSFLSNHKNNFIDFLKTIFTAVEVKKAVNDYLIGTSKRWSGATVFWQIDNFEKVHGGKILQYNPQTCKRAKDQNGKSLIDWVHSILKRSKTINEFNLQQCLFGLHLISERNIKTVALVESEKTAVIMQLFKPEFVWLATGSKHGFKYEMLLPIKQYKIIAFPDKSEYKDWLKKATELNGFGFNVAVSDWLENKDFEAGTDFADVFINEIKEAKKVEVTHSETEQAIQ